MHPRPLATAHVTSKQADFHSAVVDEVVAAIEANDVVVVGMSLNTHVKKALKILEGAGVENCYLAYGGYHSLWKERLAIKLWSGWPTFPQVFVKGRLIGGASELAYMLESGELADLLDGERAPHEVEG